MKTEQEVKKFSAAYELLGQTSTLLARVQDQDGNAEIWETGDVLLTIVDFNKLEIRIKKREQSPAAYEAAKHDFLDLGGGLT